MKDLLAFLRCGLRAKWFTNLTLTEQRPSHQWYVIAAKIKKKIYSSGQVYMRTRLSKKLANCEAQIELLSGACDRHECKIDVLSEVRDD